MRQTHQILIAIAAAYAFILVQNHLVPILIPERCDSLVGQEMRDECYKSMVYPKKDVDMCRKIGDAGFRDSCLSYFGQTNKNIALCAEIRDITYVRSCLDGNLIASDDYGKCINLLENVKDECTMRLTVRKNDTTKCESLQSALSQICLNELAIKLNDDGICARMTDKSQSAGCREKYEFHFARLRECGPISDTKAKADCFEGFGTQKPPE
ncbi:MAG: hypothetical protein V1875_09545 [Candidatus Altiarchaeota archaeon]